MQASCHNAQRAESKLLQTPLRPPGNLGNDKTQHEKQKNFSYKLIEGHRKPFDDGGISHRVACLYSERKCEQLCPIWIHEKQNHAHQKHERNLLAFGWTPLFRFDSANLKLKESRDPVYEKHTRTDHP